SMRPVPERYSGMSGYVSVFLPEDVIRRTVTPAGAPNCDDTLLTVCARALSGHEDSDSSSTLPVPSSSDGGAPAHAARPMETEATHAKCRARRRSMGPPSPP